MINFDKSQLVFKFQWEPPHKPASQYEFETLDKKFSMVIRLQECGRIIYGIGLPGCILDLNYEPVKDTEDYNFLLNLLKQCD